MNTFYEQLNVSPTATSDTIQQAFQQRYAEVLPRVNHHDPEIAQQAQQMLRVLEEARSTLLDPARRQLYDAQVSMNGKMAGLADPQAAPQTRTPASPTPASNAPQASNLKVQAANRNVWACPKCSTENQPNTRYCARCSQQLVRSCPECEEETSLLSTGRCSSCGYSYDMATQRKELRKRLHILQNERQQADSMLAEKGRLGGIGPAIIVLGLILTVVLPLMLMGVMLQSTPDLQTSFDSGSASTSFVQAMDGAATGARLLGVAVFLGTIAIFLVVRAQRKRSALQQFQPQINLLDRQIAEINRHLASLER